MPGPDRRARNGGIETAPEHFRLLAETSPDAIVTIDEESTIVFANPAVERVFGYRPDELVGRSLTLLMPERLRDRHRKGMSQYLATGRRAVRWDRIEFPGLHRGGHEIALELSFGEFQSRGRRYFTGVMRDVTERKRAEERLARAEAELERRYRQLVLLFRMAEAVARARAPEEVYREAIEGLTRVLGVSRASLLLFDPDGVIRFKAWRGLSEEYRRATAGHSPWPATARDPEPVLVPDVAADPSLEEYRDIILREGIRALAFIPITYDGALLGKFMIYHDEPHRFPPQEVRLARTVAAHVGFAVGKLKAAEELRASEATQRLLAEAGAALAEPLGYREALERLARVVVEHLADWCLVYVLEEDGRLHRVAGAHRDPARDELVRESMPYTLDPASDAPVAGVIRTGRAALLPEVREETLEAVAGGDPDHLRVLHRLRPRSGIVVPLLARGRSLGALALAATDPARRYGERDLEVANEVARRAAVAVDNARLYEQAVLANRAKSDFLAVMSHELRTPLTAVLGYADLLDAGVAGPLTPGQGEQVRRIIASARHLLGLIEEILLYSRAESEREAVRAAPVDIVALTRGAADRVRPQALGKGLGFHVDVPPGPATVVTDEAKLRQILVGLLSNAVKFTDEGEVSLEAALEDGRAVFRVRDTGIGIRPDDLERIFDPFWQVEQPTTRRTGGIGLGLSVARRLARLLGGDVAVESEPGKGSTFTVRLPAGGPPGSASPGGSGRGGRTERRGLAGDEPDPRPATDERNE